MLCTSTHTCQLFPHSSTNTTQVELWWFRQTTGSANIIYEEVRKWFRLTDVIW
jgi:hypothetical protein